MKRLVPTWLMTMGALLNATVALPAAAQCAKPEDAIKSRKAAFTAMGTHVGRVAAMANGRVPLDAEACHDTYRKA